MQKTLRLGLILFAGACLAGLAGANTFAQDFRGDSRTLATTPLVASVGATPKSSETSEAVRLNALEDALRTQSVQLEQLRKLIEEQQKTISLLTERMATASVTESPNAGSGVLPSNSETAVNVKSPDQPASVETRLTHLEDRVTKIGPFKFSGDFRLRYDGTFRTASESPNPPLTHLQNSRARYRLRLNFDTDLYPNLSFHGQLSTGPANNPLTLDQDFSSVTVRHPFLISEAWIDYHPNKAVQLQGGRVLEIFADNSRFLFDDDVRFNGFNEKYVWQLKSKPLALTNIDFRAGQYILSNPNVAVIAPGSPLANAAQIVGTTGRSANLFHQGVLFNQQFNKRWSQQFGGDMQLYRNPNQIALASTNEGLVLLVQPGIGLALSGPLPGTGTATTTPGGAIYSARSFEIARFTYRLTYAGFEHGGHMYPVNFNFQFARNTGTSLDDRDAFLAAIQIGRITKRGDMAFQYVFARKGANSLISQVTDDDLGTVTGVNIRTNHLRFDYGLAKKVTFQSLFFIQSELRNSSPGFFVPLGEFAPKTYRVQQQLVFSF